MNSEAASDLVKALEAMSQISEEQSRELAQSRGEASRLSEVFEKSLSARLDGSEKPSNLSSELLSARTSRFTEQYSRLAQREASFLNAFHALMRLYADSESRETADKVFELLRGIRTIDVGDDPNKFASEMPSFLAPSNEGGSDERNREMLGSVLKHHHDMQSFMEKKHKAWDEQIERSDALLREALAEARALL